MTRNNENPTTYELRPIGYVHASDAEGSYVLKIDEAYRPALKEMEQFSHVHKTVKTHTLNGRCRTVSRR